MTAFADHFSRSSSDYANYRPQYPAALYDWLALLTPERGSAWDCATGTGQAAVGLARHFGTVVATDASAEQLAHAERHPAIHYAAMTAEEPGLASESVALITVAQALHWLDREQFYREASRILMPEGIVAVWSYRLATVDPAIDTIIAKFHGETIGPWWPAERAVVDAGYARLPFPFAERTTPEFQMEARWTLPQLSGYLSTWSAVARYRTERGKDPIPAVTDLLLPAWGDPHTERTVRWPLDLRVGGRR